MIFKNMSNYEKFVQGGLNTSAFLLFACALSVPSGYSYGSAGLLIFSLLGCSLLLKQSVPMATWLLVSLMVFMGVLWALSFDAWWPWTGVDYLLKYCLAAFALAVVSSLGLRAAGVEWGLSVGAVGALGIAAYQYLGLDMVKASGYTNAIQFGGLAMYLGIATWCVALFGNKRWKTAGLMWLCGACGVIASLLSETRGAWVVAPILLSCMLLVLCLHGRTRLAVYALLAAVVLVVAAVLPYAAKFESRVEQAVGELNYYFKNPQQAAVTSIGQRLEQWRIAVQMIGEKPVSGWGVGGLAERKQELVNDGLAHPSIMEYGHAHNEILDMWAKRGLLGLLLLMLFYWLPLCLFWPTKKRLGRIHVERRQQALALRMSASILPIAYFGFGWTQVFFAHNSGNMFYLFAIVAFWGALQQLERRGKAV